MTAESRQLRLVIGALMVGMLLFGLDGTIVATALPTIVGELGGLGHISWVFTAYLLTSTICMPVFGKISDIYGRKMLLQLTIVVFLIGSALAGISANLLELVVFRGVQGIGGGGLMAMIFTILSDILSPRDRSKYMGYFTAVFAASSVIGPLAGGFFVDNLTWRWVFYVNIPLGALALLVIGKYLHVPKPTERRPVDYLGAGLFTIGVTVLLLASTWGGQQYAWGSPVIVGLLLGGAVLGALFVLQERRAADAMLPLRLFRDPVFSVSCTMGILLGAVMVSTSVFLPLFLQVVTGVSATSSGILLVPMMAGMLVGSTVVGRLMSRSGRYKVFPILGTVIAGGGVVELAMLTVHSGRAAVSVAMGIVGFGIGGAMPVINVAVQNTAPLADMGAATAAVNFFRSLGSAFGVAIFGTVMNAHVESTLAARLPAGATVDSKILSTPAQIRVLPAEINHAVTSAVSAGVSAVFRYELPVMLGAFLLALVLKEVPLRDTVGVQTIVVEGMESGLGLQPALESSPEAAIVGAAPTAPGLAAPAPTPAGGT